MVSGEMMERPLTIALANSGRKWIGEIAHVAMLYEQLERLGHRPWILCRRNFALERTCRERQWRHLSLDFCSHFDAWRDGRDLARAWAWARRERPDIIHCHRGADHWLGLWLARGLRRPLVRTRHVTMPVQPHVVNRWFYLHATDAVICVSEAARRSFGPWARQLPQGRVILSAVDPDRFHPEARSEAWRAWPASLPAAGGSPPLWFGLVGRIQKVKGQHVFLEAAARVAAVCPQARFLLAGLGADAKREQYQTYARQLHFDDRLRIEDYLPNLPEVLASLDVGVIASLGSEGSSRIGLEMMASGLPLVASRVGGIPDLVEPAQTGRLVAPGDAAALAEAMLAWARDAEGRRAAGARARAQVVAHHQPQDWAQKMVEIYRTVLSARSEGI